MTLITRGAKGRARPKQSNWGRAALALLAIHAGIAPVAAADFFYMDHDTLTGRYVGPVGPLVISGDIVAGDYRRLVGKIASSQERFVMQNKIIVTSEAGDVGEAIKIAKLVRSLHSDVSVGPLTGKCSGPCFLIYVAAAQRGADSEHLIGIRHLALGDAFLQENEVPAFLQREAARHTADVYWLSAADEKALGTRSPQFGRYLKARCAWDDALEHYSYTGKRPLSDLQPALACRNRVLQADARKVLKAALAAPP